MKKFFEIGLKNKLYAVMTDSEVKPLKKEFFTRQLENHLSNRSLKIFIEGEKVFDSNNPGYKLGKKYFKMKDKLEKMIENIKPKKEVFEILNDEEVTDLKDKTIYLAEVKGGFKNYDLSISLIKDKYFTINVRDFYKRIIPVKNIYSPDIKWRLNNGFLEAVLEKKDKNK